MKKASLKTVISLLVISIILVAFTGVALAQSVVGTGGESYIRSTPSLYGKQLSVLPQGASASYLGQSSVDDRGVTWYYISYGGTTGWVSSRYTTLTGDSGSYSSSYSYSTASSGTVLGLDGDSYIRSSPSLYGKQLSVLPQGASAAYLGQSSVDDRGVAWYYISYGSTTGWVSSMYTALYGSTGTYISGYSTGYSTGYIGTVYGASGDSYIRSTPSLYGKQLSALPQGASATYLGQSSVDDRGVAWYYICYGNVTGWVSSMYTTLYGTSGTYISGYTSGTVRGTDGESYIRSSPSLYGKQLSVLPRGASAAYLGQTSVDDRGVAWYYISYGGTTGWVSSMYTTLY